MLPRKLEQFLIDYLQTIINMANYKGTQANEPISTKR